MIILLSLFLTTIDGLAMIRRIVTFLQSGEKKSIKTFWRSAVLGRQESVGFGPEYTGLVSRDPEEFDKNEITLSPIRDSRELDVDARRQGFDLDTANWADDVRRQHHGRQSAASDGTLYSPTYTRSVDNIEFAKGNISSKFDLLRKIGNGAFAVLERFLVFAALGQLLTGVVIYTGTFIQPSSFDF
jgi:hypothetical protein